MIFRRISLVGLIMPLVALASTPEVLVNQQGRAQQDLSIRGGSYTGSGVSINGLNLKVPYSAHFNAELPMLGNMLSGATVQHGLDNVSGPLIGTAAYTTLPLEVNSQVAASLGTKEHYTASAYKSIARFYFYIPVNNARTVPRAVFPGAAFTAAVII